MLLAVTVFGIDIAEVLNDLGYAGLALLMVAETVFPPIPSEAVLPLAGYLVEQGDFNFALVLITATAGSVFGAVLLYEAARYGGRPFAERFMRFGRLDPAKMEQAERWFEKRGPIVIVLGRCVPGVRSLVSLPAGLLRMGRIQYLFYTVLGSLLWNTILVGAGWILGTQWERVSDIVGPLSKPLLALALVGGAALLTWQGLRARRNRQARSAS